MGRNTMTYATNWGPKWITSLPQDHCKALRQVHIISSIRGMQLDTASLWVKILSFEKLGLVPVEEFVERYDWGTKIVVSLDTLDP